MAKRSKPLEIVARVVKNMPITGVEYLYTDTDYGRVYIALGKVETENRYMGAWAFTVGPGLMQTIEFKPNQERKAVIKALEEQAVWLMGEMHKRQMLTEGYFSGGR